MNEIFFGGKSFVRFGNSPIYLRISIFMMLANETINPRAANLQFAFIYRTFCIQKLCLRQDTQKFTSEQGRNIAENGVIV